MTAANTFYPVINTGSGGIYIVRLPLSSNEFCKIDDSDTNSIGFLSIFAAEYFIIWILKEFVRTSMIGV